MGLKSTKVKYVELPHTDATAVPKDVKKGKVFYNNDGRQVGTTERKINLEVLKTVYGENVKSVVITKNNMTNGSVEIHYRINVTKEGYIDYAGIQGTTLPYTSPKYNGKVVAIECDGKFMTFDTVSDRSICLEYANIISVLQGEGWNPTNTFRVKVDKNSNSSVVVYYTT